MTCLIRSYAMVSQCPVSHIQCYIHGPCLYIAVLVFIVTTCLIRMPWSVSYCSVSQIHCIYMGPMSIYSYSSIYSHNLPNKVICHSLSYTVQDSLFNAYTWVLCLYIAILVVIVTTCLIRSCAMVYLTLSRIPYSMYICI